MSAGQVQLILPSGMGKTGVYFANSPYLTRGSDFTGNADGKLGTFSCWFKIHTAQASRFVSNANGYHYIIYNGGSTNTVQVVGFNAAVSQILNIATTASFTADSTWHHVAASWNLGTAAVQMYSDGVSGITTTTNINDNVKYTDTNQEVGNHGGAGVFDADLAFLYYNNATTLDLSTNLTKFRSSGGRAVDLGTNGATPTGSQPILYLRHVNAAAASDFQTNQGSGGGLSLTGNALTESTTTPGP